VRLARSMKTLRQMISTLILTIPQLLNVGALLLLLIFIYAIAGVQLFAQVAWDGQYVTAQANFQNTGYAMLTLYRWLTGENWVSFSTVAPDHTSVYIIHTALGLVTTQNLMMYTLAG
jgi:hypothetical protein